MNPSTGTGLIEQLFFQQNYLAGQYAEMMDRLGSVARFSGSTFVVVVLGGLLLGAAALAIYRPKLRRGALWIPAFGLFGGTPTLYMHTRPASVCGIFASGRRLHRATAWGKTRQASRSKAQ